MPPRPPQHSNEFHNTRHTYIPERAQRIMAQRMERTLPASMKKYAAAYVQQNVVEPNIAGSSFGPQAVPHVNPHPVAAPNFQQQNHFQQPGQQLPAQPAAPLPAATVAQPGTSITPSPVATPAAAQAQVQPAAVPGQPAVPAEPYDFIMDPGAKPPSQRTLPRLDSMFKRIAFGAGGLVLLLIIFTVLKSLLGGTSNLTPFVGIVQDQQEIIHLTTPSSTSNNTQQQNLTVTGQNFVATTNASLTSSQAALIAYLASNKLKVSNKQMNLKLNPQFDTQLTSGATNGNYDQVFQQVMKAQLTSYMNDLNQTYSKTSGKKGRALLTSDYAQAKLLLTQLGTAGSGQ